MQPLPLRSRLLYASSSLGSEAVGQARGLWLLYFYAPPADADIEQQLPRALVVGLLVAARLIDSADDALVGFWSDRTRSRWGRRIPFIVGATPLWAIFFVLLFMPPEGSTATTALYFFVVLEVGSIFATLSGGPYEALLPEIAPENEDRVKIVGMRVYFGAAGAAIGLVLASVLKDVIGFRGMAIALASLALVMRYAGLAGVWQRAKASQESADVGFREAMRQTFENRYFLLFLPTFVLFQIGYQMLVGVLPYFVNAELGVDEDNEGTWVAALAAVAIVAVLVSLPLFARYALRTSKRQAYRRAMVGAAVVFPLAALPGLVPGIPAEVALFGLMVLVGLPVAGNYLFPAPLTADIIDYDSTRTGMRREATYYGAQNFVEKTATAIVPLLLLCLLVFGDTADDPLGIHLVGPVAGAIVFGGYLVFRRYDLPDEVPGRAIPEPARSAPQ
ncbi:MAG TPA: MFS transporter [Gaiellaceae bacterium]|nr:MFS transporter [Gaiellaceae bacterium]